MGCLMWKEVVSDAGFKRHGSAFVGNQQLVLVLVLSFSFDQVESGWALPLLVGA